MGLFNRPLIVGVNVAEKATPGSGFVGSQKVKTIATDAAITLTIPDIAGGVVVFSGFTAGRNITVPTGAEIEAAGGSEMAVGECFMLVFGVTPSFTGTWVAATGVTLAGKAAVPSAGFRLVFVEKVSANNYIWNNV